MGIPKKFPNVPKWASSLAEMKKADACVIRSCSSPCTYWKAEDIDELIGLLGPDAALHGERPPCPRCDRLMHFMASPSESTPMRPLLKWPHGPDPKRPAEGWPEWPGVRLR